MNCRKIFFSRTFVSFFILLSWLSLPVNALTPIRQYTDLVAGRGEEGYRDGSFTQSKFNDPCSLAVNSDGTRLFVADKENNCIRVILLDQKNEVQTLAGIGEAGYNDGPSEHAKFNKPTQIVWLPTNQLAVYDAGNRRIRLIDLQTKLVTTLAGNGKDADGDGPAQSTPVSGIWNLLYNPADDCLYFSQPDLGALRRLSLKAKMIETLLKSAPEMLNPKALCLYKNQVCVADKTLPDVYVLTVPKEVPTTNTALTLGKVAGLVLTPQGKVTHALALGSSDDNLYALQSQGYSWVCIAPDSRPVSIDSVLGNLFEPSADDGEHGIFFKLPEADTIGFIADPKDIRRFFISSSTINAIYSVRDYSFDKFSTSELIGPDDLTDYNYPKVKPPNTFRILVTGDSRTFSFSPDSSHAHASRRIYSLSKRLEFTLNTMAALEDIPISFQVLSFGMTMGEGYPEFVWPTYVTPGVVQKYDIDMVLMSLEPNDSYYFISIYLENPLSKLGLPTGNFSPEYALLPVDKRIPPGPARDLIDRGLKSKLFHRTKTGDIQFVAGPLILEDEAMRKDAEVLVGRPVSFLADELSKLKTQSGHPIIFQPFFMPVGNPADTYPTEPAHQMWLGASKRCDFPLLDMTDDFIALRTSYFPVMDNIGSRHFTVPGEEWFTQILSWELIHRGLIPPLKKETSETSTDLNKAKSDSPTPIQ